MKKFIVYFLIIVPSFSYAQNSVYLTFNKTVHMFFPAEISYYDVGSDDILIQSNSDILKLAPKTANFSETNLTVITSNNICYSFLVKYNSDIQNLTYFVKDSLGQKIGSLARTKVRTDSLSKSLPFGQGEGEYISVCRDLIKKAPAYWLGSTVKKVFLAMNNIYVHNDRLYFVVSVGNTSNINYDINFIKFYIVDKKKLKRASRQEVEKIPVYSFNNIETINAQTNDHPIILCLTSLRLILIRSLSLSWGRRKVDEI
ncbi:MAG: DUF4138 domain-containing protein [Chloroflexia bacterium]|nr:DUF4138 domain-containing protein [Chloroflexia bacterium]